MRRKVVIMGAAGRDFHNFNVRYRSDPRYEVVAFTAAQIPGIANRVYPYPLSGDLYPNGIPILSESELPSLIERHSVDEVVLAYSDLSFQEVMEKASLVISKGADFVLLGPRSTCLKSRVPVVAVTAVRTGAGKSTVTRHVVRLLKLAGRRVVVVRHPMPYVDLRTPVQRFSSYEDLERYNCTFEEREEYEPHIREGNVVYAGVDYAEVLKRAEEEAEVIVWDGGNNDYPFFWPDVHIVVADALRPGHERSYHPGMANLLMADVVVVNKANAASREQVEAVLRSVRELNPRARIALAGARVEVEGDEDLRDKRVVVIEDAPTVTHGGMPHAAGYVAATEAKAVIVDPRPFAVGTVAEIYRTYKHIGPVLPSLGYTEEQRRDLEETLRRIDCDLLVNASPTDLSRTLRTGKRFVHVRYELQLQGPDVIAEALKGKGIV
jgi:predicted GTPase